MDCFNPTVPIGNSIGKVLAGNWYPVILLSLLDLDFNFVIFAEIRDLLHCDKSTLESTQPLLMPSLFIATKFLGGSLTDETLCSSHPDTTALKRIYLLSRHTDPWLELCRRYVLQRVDYGSRLCSCQVQIFVEARFPLTSSVVNNIIFYIEAPEVYIWIFHSSFKALLSKNNKEQTQWKSSFLNSFLS